MDRSEWIACVVIGFSSLLIAEGVSGVTADAIPSGARSALEAGVLFGVTAGMLYGMNWTTSRTSESFAPLAQLTGAISLVFFVQFGLRFALGGA